MTDQVRRCELCGIPIPNGQSWCCFEHARVVLARTARPAPTYRRRWAKARKP